MEFFLVGVADLKKKIRERNRQRGGDDLLVLAVGVEGKVVLDGTIDGLVHNNFNQGRHNGISGSLFILFDRSCGSTFNRIFDLDGRGLGGRLGGDRDVRCIASSMGGLVDFAMVIGG